jgi:hypothetical protein
MMNYHAMAFDADERRQARLQEAEQRWAFRAAFAEPKQRESWRARWPFAVVRRLARLAEAS